MSLSFTTMRKRLSRFLLIVIAKTLGLAGRLVPYRVAVTAGGALGFIAYYLLPRDRKRALSHLRTVYPEQGEAWVERIARRTFVHLGKSLLEEVSISQRRLRSIVTFQGMDNLRSAIAQGKGIIIVTGHIGNWELLGAAVSAEHPVSVVAAPIEPEPLNDLIVKLRANLGVRTILRGQPGAARELIRVFKENRVLGILIDQDTDVEGAFVDFMGRPAWTPTAAAQMAIKFEAPVLFGHIHRTEDGRHIATVEGPLELTRTGKDAQDIVVNTARFTKLIENVIRKDPEQWVWMHRRWRRQP